MKQFTYIIALMLLTAVAFAQNAQIDSIKAALSVAQTDSLRINLLNSLAFGHIFYDKAKAYEYVEQSLQLSEQAGYMRGKSDALNNKGLLLRIDGLYEQALEHHLKALDLSKACNYQLGIAFNLGNIGMVYSEQENHAQAINYYQQALVIKEQLKDSLSMAFTLSDLATAHVNNKAYKEALAYSMRSLGIHQALNNKGGEAYSYFTVGEIYLLLGQYEDAVRELQKADMMCKEMKNTFVEVLVLCKLAEAYYGLNDNTRALEVALGSLKMAQQNGMKKDIKNAALILSKIYERQKLYEQAYQYQNMFVAYKDSLQSLDVEKKTALLAAKYEYTQKELALKTEHDQAQRLQWWINGGTAALLLAISAVALYVHSSRKRLREAYAGLERNNAALKAAKADIQAKNDELFASEEELRQTAEELTMVNERIMEEKRKTDDAFKALQEAKTQLVQSEKMASLGQLTAGIAHEINNPVNFIAGGAQGLRLLMGDAISLFEKYRKFSTATADKEKLGKEIEELRSKVGSEEELKADVMGLLEDIEKGADRVTEIVRGLRNFSRSDNELRISDQLHDNINNTLLVLRNKYKERIEIVKQFDPNIQSIECFPGQLSQVFMNIISNGIEAIDGKGQIVISTKDAGENVQVSIKDNGPGIPEEIRARIFDPFFTTKGVGKGTGLGLSIVHGIVEKHQGSIEVYSEIGKGTEFLITLPK